jgi:hypothetical protein
MINQFLDWAHSSLLANDDARSYLSGRCVSEDQLIRHKIGYIQSDYCVDTSRDPCHSEICNNKEQKHLWCDSCRYNNWSSTWDAETHERFIGRRINNCIVLPLTDYTNNYVGFQIRSMVEKVYDTFKLRRCPYGYFFGLGPNIDVIWAKKEITLVEGAFDQLTYERNVVALTTNSIGVDQLKFVVRFVTSVNSCLDLDAAGRKGVASLIDKLSRFPDIGFHDIKYPKISMGNGLKETKDLNEFWKKAGDVAFSSYFRKQLQEM